ncbi:non-ribosomal peptide synthetase [Acetonema longum]|uniref:Tyrocidine synthetase II n=1 Tax=Acetonema longum DSM 6540 TaxID=1009370 RepID=F7NDS8_9FIRM|nr:non-ribosomal peptide synthetase [Acetonema longum]EGO65799.1 tyrocidine synthetase II [Acetonema longum DSM 6540]
MDHPSKPDKQGDIKANIKKIFALSPMQKGMLFHALLDSQSPAYFEQVVFFINGKLDRELVQASFRKLIERHDVFRTVFVYEKVSSPVQVVLKTRDGSIAYHDVSGLSEPEKAAFVDTYKSGDKAKGFDLTKDIPLRVALIKINEDAYQLIWSFHHIIMDGWCMGIILREFFAIYGALKDGRSPGLSEAYPYSGYIKWLEDQDQGAAASYWKEYTGGCEAHALPAKNGGLRRQGEYQPAEAVFQIGAGTHKNLEDIAAKNHVTLNTVLQTLWGIVLQRYANTDDVVFGAVVSGRPHEIAGVESIVGLFINTLPVRIKGGGTKLFAALLAEVQQAAVESEQYSYYPLADIQAGSGVKGALFDHIMAFENYPMEEVLHAGPDAALGFAIDGVEAFEQTNYDLNVVIAPGNELGVKFSYNALAFRRDFIEQLAGHFKAALAGVTGNPDLMIKDIDILTAEERRQLLDDFNHTQREYPKNKTVQELFEEQAARTPDNAAAVYQERRLTCRELNERANQLARLLWNRGVQANSIVGILAERSPELLIGILAIVKAGGAYLPIDPEYPPERISYMLADSGAGICLTQRHLAAAIDFSGEVIALDDPDLYQGDPSNLPRQNTPQDLAYVIYTSGSTGKPKGVEIRHASLVNLICWHRRVYEITPADRGTLLAGQAFDASVWEIWPYLTAGAGIYIPDSETRASVTGLIQWLKDNRISVSFMPTPMAEVLLAEEWPEDMSLRALLTGGDKLRCRPDKKMPFTLLNHYGPTENTVVTTWAAVDPAAPQDVLPTIGRPVDNTKIYILDSCDRLQPVGAPGELCISGDGLARGYLNRPELTAEKFVPNPFLPGEKMYRTGDLASWLPDGDIEFLGRIDHQVKIRGFRIELGEIEAELLKHPSVRESVVSAKGDPAGNQYLCAYLVPAEQLPVADLRAYLAKALPEYMIPAVFIQLDNMPLTPNGKIDRRALPEPEGDFHTGTAYVAPRTETEQRMARIWQDVLGTAKAGIGIEDNFFELGGHSLKAVTLASRLHKEFGVEVPLRKVFERPTIKELARYCEGAGQSGYTAISPAAEQAYYPASSAQRRMFILNQLNSGDTAYNMPAAFRVEGDLDTIRFTEALQGLVRRHEILRTSFELADGELVQKIHEEVNFTVEFLRSKEEAIPAVIKKFIRPFVLQAAPLFRVGLVKISDHKHVVLFDMHHIASDGVTMGILVRELMCLYDDKPLPELRIQYKDFSVWQNNLQQTGGFRRQEQYWLQTFDGDLPVLNMPLDYPRPSARSLAGERLRQTVGEEVTAALHNLAGQTGTTLYMVLLAAYTILLSKHSGQEDIIVGSPVAGRPHADLENIAGMFVNTLAMRNYPAGHKSFREFLDEVGKNALAAFEHQEYPFEELVNKLAIPRDAGRNPLFDALFSLQNIDIAELMIGDLTFIPYEFENKTAKFDLNLLVMKKDNRLELMLTYDAKLFKAATAVRILQDFVKILQAITEDSGIVLNRIALAEQYSKRKAIKQDLSFNL